MRRKTLARRCEYCAEQQREESKRCTCSPIKPRTHQSMSSYRRKDINSSVLTNHSKELESHNQELRLLANDNSRLKAQNSRLRRDMERMQPNDMSNETLLQDRLYQSNKALQQSILNLDLCGRANKELEDKLTLCRVANEQLKVEREALIEQCQKYKNKLKKSMEIARNSRTREQLQPRSTNDSLLEKYTQITKKNKQLELLVEQLQDELSRTSSVVRPEFGWARKTAKKINCIEQNITRIEENHEEITQMKEQLQSLHSEFKNKMSIVSSCQDYVEQQLAATVRCFPSSISTEVTKGFQFAELNRVTLMMAHGELKDIISKMNIAGPLSRLLNGLTQHTYSLLETISAKFEGRLRRIQSQLKTSQRKLANLSKLISNNRLKSRTERTRMRHISLASKLEHNKENIDLNN